MHRYPPRSPLNDGNDDGDGASRRSLPLPVHESPEHLRSIDRVYRWLENQQDFSDCDTHEETRGYDMPRFGDENPLLRELQRESGLYVDDPSLPPVRPTLPTFYRQTKNSKSDLRAEGRPYSNVVDEGGSAFQKAFENTRRHSPDVMRRRWCYTERNTVHATGPRVFTRVLDNGPQSTSSSIKSSSSSPSKVASAAHLKSADSHPAVTSKDVRATHSSRSRKPELGNVVSTIADSSAYISSERTGKPLADSRNAQRLHPASGYGVCSSPVSHVLDLVNLRDGAHSSQSTLKAGSENLSDSAQFDVIAVQQNTSPNGSDEANYLHIAESSASDIVDSRVGTDDRNEILSETYFRDRCGPVQHKSANTNRLFATPADGVEGQASFTCVSKSSGASPSTRHVISNALAFSSTEALHRRELSDSCALQRLETQAHSCHNRVSSAPVGSNMPADPEIRKEKALSWPKRTAYSCANPIVAKVSSAAFVDTVVDRRLSGVPVSAEEFKPQLDSIRETKHVVYDVRQAPLAESEQPGREHVELVSSRPIRINVTSRQKRQAPTDSLPTHQSLQASSVTPSAKLRSEAEGPRISTSDFVHYRSRSSDVSVPRKSDSARGHVYTAHYRNWSLDAACRRITDVDVSALNANRKMSLMEDQPFGASGSVTRPELQIFSESATPDPSYLQDGQDEQSRKESLTLKDLIRLHESEIARASSSSPSSRVADPSVDGSKRNVICRTSSSDRDTDSWKRHTTIGLFRVDKADSVCSSEVFDRAEQSRGDRTMGELDQGSSGEFLLRTVDRHEFKAPNALRKDDTNVQLDSCESGRSETQKKISKVRLLPSAESRVIRSDSLSSVGSKSPPLIPPKPASSRDSVLPALPHEQLAGGSNANYQAPLSNRATRRFCDQVVQTDVVVNEERQRFEESLTKIKEEFAKERRDLQKRLDEQRKVANAYQKLEDRYRKKVHELQQSLRQCHCGAGLGSGSESRYCDGYGSPRDSQYALLGGDPDHDMSVQRVDSILHQLESWLNRQTTGLMPEGSYHSSRVQSPAFTDSMTSSAEIRSRLRLSADTFTSPPLEIIDRIDATCV